YPTVNKRERANILDVEVVPKEAVCGAVEIEVAVRAEGDVPIYTGVGKQGAGEGTGRPVEDEDAIRIVVNGVEVSHPVRLPAGAGDVPPEGNPFECTHLSLGERAQEGRGRGNVGVERHPIDHGLGGDVADRRAACVAVRRARRGQAAGGREEDID